MAEIIRLDAPLVVGAGVAGSIVALHLPRSYLLSASDPGSSWWAQRGIAAALGPDDSPRLHAADTVREGAGLVAEEMAEILAAGAADAIERLSLLGASLDRGEEEGLLLSAEPGHSRPRIVGADGDATGAEVMRALTEAIEASRRVTTITGRAVDLVMGGDRVAGVVTADGQHRRLLLAPGVVLATGGMGRLFSRTTNPPGIAGDGIAMAARVGARLSDLEFVQFHPTALDAGKDPMPVITAVLREEGATLVDAHGRRFAERWHPGRERAPRHILARAVQTQVEAGDGAYLDARGIPSLAERFPAVAAHAASVGLDPSQHLLPVSPAAHNSMGGIDVDGSGRTTVPGLWAVGECGDSGLHGADRLPSNSLLEGLVFGVRVAQSVAGDPVEAGGEIMVPEQSLDLPVVAGPVLDDLRQAMWHLVGVERSAAGLVEAQAVLAELGPVLRRTVAGRVAADVAGMMVDAALARSESRGSHYRSDHPVADPAQARRTLIDPVPVALVGVD